MAAKDGRIDGIDNIFNPSILKLLSYFQNILEF
ncbi:MAG: hypothetical protein SCABRO_03974 [Candidatus Scalindua brodae]|uniref:Uncharacterized protein n=1 Tax=Candidatus Scalindua brodae TaxID=237368 RepID=A0A0B0EC77_9BACT|nr:MAG: hypothetical protein SCABRO_03974 [Candidatus Scalindua brodae]